MCYATAFETEGWRRIPVVMLIFEKFNVETENLKLLFHRVTHPLSMDTVLPNFRPSSVTFDDVLSEGQCCVVQVAYNFLPNLPPRVHASVLCGADETHYQLKNSSNAEKVIKIPKARLTYFQYLSHRSRPCVTTPNDIDSSFDNNDDYMFIDEGYGLEFCVEDESRSSSRAETDQYFSGYEFSDTDSEYYTTDYDTDYDNVTECNSETTEVSDDDLSDAFTVEHMSSSSDSWSEYDLGIESPIEDQIEDVFTLTNNDDQLQPPTIPLKSIPIPTGFESELIPSSSIPFSIVAASPSYIEETAPECEPILPVNTITTVDVHRNHTNFDLDIRRISLDEVTGPIGHHRRESIQSHINAFRNLRPSAIDTVKDSDDKN